MGDNAAGERDGPRSTDIGELFIGEVVFPTKPGEKKNKFIGDQFVGIC